MQPSPTKKTEASNAPEVLPWHPNFRNYERLPDIKAVRTSFFVNTIAITITLLFAAWVASREYHLSSLEKQIADAQEQIDRMRKPSDQAVQLFGKFQNEERRFNEVDAFINSRFPVDPIIVHLSSSLPTGIALNFIDLKCDDRGKGKTGMLVLRGIARGSADKATGRASSYEIQLRKDPVLSPMVESVSLTNATRSASDDRLSFEIQLKLKAPSK